MLEPAIAKKCVVALGTAGAAVLLSLFLSRQFGASERAEERSPPLQESPAAASGQTAPPMLPAASFSALPPPLPPEQAAVAEAEASHLERALFRMEMENARLRTRLDDMLNWILDNVRGTFPLPEEQMAHLRLQAVDGDMAVSDALIQILRLDEEETEQLDAAFMEMRSILQDIETAYVAVETPSEYEVVLTIPSYSEEGQLVREGLYDELLRTLGAARFDRFLQVAKDSLEEQFDYFGEPNRKIQFEMLADEDSDAPQLFVRDERVWVDQKDPFRQTISSSERVVTELPPEYYSYWYWLPEHVTRFAARSP
ncbi:MAG: hypothetical protein LBN38_07910 [Verrucomicrobiota bacterium]|jgi:hypothetical protein|nr:hypothetical protein [Verrucomicrobiota bacterium]